jgi:glycosyltransferase involved in cell wall biosynthesis
MSIVIFGDLFSFPDGKAATNRVHTYAKGFVENGTSVYIVCFSNEYRIENYGLIDGISYNYPFNQTLRNRYLIVRRWQKLLKYFKTIILIRKINEEDKIVAINLWSNLFLTHLFAWFLAKVFGTKLVSECSEHPLSHHQFGRWKRFQGLVKLYFESRLYDGVLCISNYLIEYYKSKGLDEAKLFLVPSTVEPSRFLQRGESPLQNRYIGYFGSLTFSRDNLDLLINAFADISVLHPEFHLVLGGFCTEKEKKEIEELLHQLDVSKSVLLVDYLTREEIITYITHADILVMVRSRDLDSQASYPSKLTEFLATSKPVISVVVGEISDYLTDGVNAFLVEPENVDALAHKLTYVIDNYNLARDIGIRGKELTETIFNYNFQAKRIIGFINILNRIS